jgi:hypothetical protein
MSAPKPADDLLLRYHEACAQDERRPASAVREAVRAHAAMVIRAHPGHASPSTPQLQAAANQPRWKLSLLASVALVGLTSLLVLQFDRGTPEEQELALGRPNDSLAKAPRSPAPATAPQPRANPTEKLSDAALPPPRVVSKRLADAVSQGKLSAVESKTDLFEGRREGKAPPSTVEGAIANPSVMSTAPSPAPAPAQVAPTTPSLQLDVAPAPARSLGSVDPYRAGAMSANTAQRAAAAPEAADSSRHRLEKPELQMQRSQERSDKAAPSAQELKATLLDSARTGQVAQMERLLQQGALINSIDEQGRTPLILAAMNGHTTTVAKLLALGANPALTDREGLNALQHARRLGFNQIANLLEAGP